MKTNSKKLEKSQLEIEFELSPEEFQKYFNKAILHYQDHIKVDGFRKGQVPLKMVEEKVEKENLLMEAGDLAVKDSYTKFVTENKLEPIGNPEVQILKIAKGSPLLFKVKIALLPEIQLPDYKEIVSKIPSNKVSVDEKEIEDAVIYLQKSRAKFSPLDKPADKKDFVEIEYQNEGINNGKVIKDRFTLGEGGFMKDFEDNLIGMKAGEEKQFKAKFPENTPNKALAGKESDFKVKMLSVQKMEIPEINDEFAKSLGVFDSLVALKDNLKEGITLEKQETEVQRKRGEMLEKITKEITFELPEKMVEYEQTRLFEDLKNNISAQFKISFEQYLATVKKTEKELKDSFKLEAEKRIKNYLVLQEIGKKENIEITDKEIEEEANKELRRYPKEQAVKIDIEQLKEYSEGALFNEKVFQKLESFSE